MRNGFFAALIIFLTVVVFVLWRHAEDVSSAHKSVEERLESIRRSTDSRLPELQVSEETWELGEYPLTAPGTLVCHLEPDPKRVV